MPMAPAPITRMLHSGIGRTVLRMTSSTACHAVAAGSVSAAARADRSCGIATSEECFVAIRDLTRKLGKSAAVAEDFPAFNAAFAEFLNGEKVTRTCIGGTPHRKGVNVEIDCVAMFDQ